MRKIYAWIIVCCSVLAGCGSDSPQLEIKEPNIENYILAEDIANTAEETSFAEYQIVYSEGMTLEERFVAPEGYGRVQAEEDSLATFLRKYPLKEHGTPVLLYDGRKKGNQSAHAAVFKLPIEEYDLQQCADSVIRVYAEYYWSRGEYDKIAFHFTNGFLCEYTKFMEGYCAAVSGNDVSWKKTAEFDDSYDTFVTYLRMVFSYAGTLSMDAYESYSISLPELDVGDVLLKGGSPGHVVMVVDACENTDGQKAFLLAQGYMPAQEFHVLKNPAHENDPWYYENEMIFPLQTAEYTFSDKSMIRRLHFAAY